jgi:hypothetical protein
MMMTNFRPIQIYLRYLVGPGVKAIFHYLMLPLFGRLIFDRRLLGSN